MSDMVHNIIPDIGHVAHGHERCTTVNISRIRIHIRNVREREVVSYSSQEHLNTNAEILKRNLVPISMMAVHIINTN